jgi:hypothetical protein
MSYNPNPPRVWSRVQNQCTYTVDSSYQSVYVPLNNRTELLAVADYQEKILYKGNILQYKKNSSNLTKNQRYSQISKGKWTNRTKTFATQSQTYSNPNTTGLQRVNYTTFSYPNGIVGAPNNVSGPFQAGVQSPYDCPTTSIQDGGSLICNKYANPCTGDILKQTKVINCYPTTCSDVPGRIQELCWDERLQTYYPRSRHFMSNSGTKWPEGYKGFVSAIVPVPPVLTLVSYTGSSVTLSWTDVKNECVPISSFNIFQNGSIVQSVSYTVKNITITGLVSGETYSFYITAVSTTISSNPSNIVSVTI